MTRDAYTDLLAESDRRIALLDAAKADRMVETAERACDAAANRDAGTRRLREALQYEALPTFEQVIDAVEDERDELLLKVADMKDDLATTRRRSMDVQADLEIERAARIAAEARADRYRTEAGLWACAACMLLLGALVAIVHAM